MPRPGLRIPVAPVRPTDDGSLMEGRIMPVASLCGDCHPETDRRDWRKRGHPKYSDSPETVVVQPLSFDVTLHLVFCNDNLMMMMLLISPKGPCRCFEKDGRSLFLAFAPRLTKCTPFFSGPLVDPGLLALLCLALLCLDCDLRSCVSPHFQMLFAAGRPRSSGILLQILVGRSR